MFICPTCSKEYEKEEDIVKHFLSCWKEKNPVHESKAAPRSADIEVRKVDAGVEDFFASFKKGK